METSDPDMNLKVIFQRVAYILYSAWSARGKDCNEEERRWILKI